MYKELVVRLRDFAVELNKAEDALLVRDAADAIEKLSKEQKKGKNIATEYDEVDQFVCSECGIELQNWVRVERDEDDGDITNHEYRFNFCPNCSADIRVET